MSLLDDILAKLQVMTPEQLAETQKAVKAAGIADMAWLPSPGPQTQAYLSPADVLLYGGQGGGGKTDLLLGLAFTAHQRSLILRRKYTNLGAITERALQIHGSRDGYNGSPPPLLRVKSGGVERYIQFAGCQHLGDEQDWQGQPFDYKGFDEATQFLKAQILFHLGWIRTTAKKQRCRAVLATNPPVDADGDWIIGYFRPWLDITHPKPAKTGELRWFVTAPDGSDLEVDGPSPVQLPGMNKPAAPASRSFIPAALSDNPYLVNTGYQSKLDALPEPLRSAVRDGNFMATRSDAEWQVIPTAWVIAAQTRWKEDGWRELRMTAAGLDIGAGRDETVLAMRYGGWYAPLQAVKGEEAKDPSHAAALVVKHRKHGCPIVVDVGGGFGGASMMLFKENGIAHRSFNGAGRSTAKSRDSKLSFVNKRAEAWWRFREELDPDQEGGSVIALPPDPQLRADLTAPTWEQRTNGILVESKEDIKKRLGRSPDRGDAVVMALSEGNAAVATAAVARNGPPVVQRGYEKIKQRYQR